MLGTLSEVAREHLRDRSTQQERKLKSTEIVKSVHAYSQEISCGLACGAVLHRVLQQSELQLMASRLLCRSSRDLGRRSQDAWSLESEVQVLVSNAHLQRVPSVAREKPWISLRPCVGEEPRVKTPTSPI